MKSHCNDCEMDPVFWTASQRGTHERHEGGKRHCRFPCRSCDHLDCADERGDEAKAAARLGVEVIAC